MNHQPFETWLLTEQLLSREEQRALQVHLQNCAHCTALAEVGIALRATKLAAPAVGFVGRFEARLEAQRVSERRNRIIGIVILALGALTLIGWSAAPYLRPILGSPTEMLSLGLQFVFSLRDMLQAIANVGSILLRVLPDFISPLALSLMLSIIGGLGWLWARSLWKFPYAQQGVTQ